MADSRVTGEEEEEGEEREGEESRAEIAREFRKNLNCSRPSRKRYSFSPQFRQQQAESIRARFPATYSTDNSLDRSLTLSITPSDPFLTSDAVSVGVEENVALDSRADSREAIYRELQEQESLSKLKNRIKELIPQPIRKSLLPPRSWKEWKSFFLIHLPIIQWVWTYRRKQLIGDIVAGVTIGVTHIPQGIGFALLANLPPVYGLYSSFVPVILYSVFGSSRHISVGTFPVVALMVGDAVTRITAEHDYCSTNVTENTNSSSNPCYLSQCDTLKVDVAVTLSFMVGIIMILMSFMKLGVMTLLLSDSLISGYTAAAAFTILVTQIKFLFGLNAMDAFVKPGVSITPRRIYVFSKLIFTGQVNGASIVTALICIIILIAIDQLNGVLSKYIRKIPIHIPAQLLVVILATGISFGAMLTNRFNLPVIDNLGGIPPGKCYGLQGHGVTSPNTSLMVELITDAFVIAIISFVINISQAKLIAKKKGYSVHPDQEFFAYGAMNFGASFFGSFPTAAALSRTVLQDATGGNTQLVGIISSSIVLLVILFLGSLFGPLPNATLAAIVVVALKGLYFQVRDIYKFYKLSFYDMSIWIFVFVSTLLVGLDLGLGLGVNFSLFLILFRTVLPYSPALGQAKAWHYPPELKFADEDFDKEDLKVHRIHGVYIYQFNSPLYFASAGVFCSRLYIETGIDPTETTDTMTQGSLQQCANKVKGNVQLTNLVSSTGSVNVQENTTSNVILEESDCDDDDEIEYTYHTIVLDCAPIVFVDSAGIAALEQVVREYDGVGVQVLLASTTTPLCVALKSYGFFNRYSSERIFPTVSSAVSYAKDGQRVPHLEHTSEPDISLASNLERQFLYYNRPSLFEAKPIELEHRGRQRSIRHTVHFEESVL